MKIFLVGGGSGGPVTPLIAVAEELVRESPSTQIFFVGVSRSAESRYYGALNFKYTHLVIPAGKWRRYFSLRNIFDLVKTGIGFFKSLYLIWKFRPDMVFGAGSFVQVPLCWAAFFLRVPVIIHQQDFELLLSTKLVMPPASAVTVSFMKSQKDIYSSSGLFQRSAAKKIVWTGNPVRDSLKRAPVGEARKFFSLSDKHPTVLIMGGGAGSAAINNIVVEALPELVKYVQIIHVTGLGKRGPSFVHENYHFREFLDSAALARAYAASDLVVARGGLGTISEISVLRKPAILVPLPDSPQVANVAVLAMSKAVIGITQNDLNADRLLFLVRKVLWNHEIQETLKTNIGLLMPPDAQKRIVKVINNIYEQSIAKKKA